jgi:3D (Asp-Asp-Asp) domain-containing protein
MKRVLISVLVIIGAMSGQVSFGAWYDSCELRTFKATAYYSPQEGQRFYVKGSLEEDKILNGNGTHGASGRAVFNGMIAAPKSYAFGTRIYVPGRGIGQIEDRGGAIVSAWERNEPFDRLDFWAGAWQAGLDAALRFGVRYFDGYVCPKGAWGDAVWFSFWRIPLVSKQPATLRETELAPGVTSTRNPILQRYLKTLW